MPPSESDVARAITDSSLLSVLARVVAGTRLGKADGVLLYRTADLTGVGAMANLVRERLHGSRTHFVRNAHVNYTNVCDKHCRFCYFAKSPKDGGPRPYVLTPKDVEEALAPARDAGVREVHIVGGIHPGLEYRYYLDVLRSVRSVLPEARIKAFTAVELDQIAKVAHRPLSAVLPELQEAGLSSVPGGGAEVLSDRVHALVHPAKLTPAQWLDVSRAVARAGLPQYATMLCGHVETLEERVDHLIALRELQDETGHILAMTPLSFHPENTYLDDLPRPGGRDDLRNVAVSRLMLDNIDHIKTFWIMSSVGVSQAALWYGADDFDGTVRSYEITFAEGRFGDRSQELTVDTVRDLISEAGREPVERDSLYRHVVR